jgi:hypothetical protein
MEEFCMLLAYHICMLGTEIPTIFSNEQQSLLWVQNMRTMWSDIQIIIIWPYAERFKVSQGKKNKMVKYPLGTPSSI